MAVTWKFEFYNGGIFSEKSNKKHSHVVSIVSLRQKKSSRTFDQQKMCENVFRLVLGSTKRLEQNTGSDATVGALGGESSDTSGLVNTMLFYPFDLQANH